MTRGLATATSLAPLRLLTMAAAAAIVVLAGCAGPRLRPQDLPPGLARHVELVATPFVAQSDFQCGPAAAAMVLGARGRAVDLQTLVDQIYTPGRQGSLQPDMVSAVRRHGLLAYEGRFDLPALFAWVDAGEPVIVLQNLGLDWIPVWHYAVVIGYDLDERTVILRSGRDERLAMDFTPFANTWERGGSWALIALDPADAPKPANLVDYLRAALALERSEQRSGQRAAALKAYDTASRRWPESELPFILAGNAQLAANAPALAEAEYRRALARNPRSGAAWNNLAQALLARGERAEARAAAERALALGGAFATQARETLKQIEQ